MNKVLIEILSHHTLDFFTRIARALTNTGATVHFATNELDLYFHARTSVYPVFLLRRHASQPATPDLAGNQLVKIGAYTRDRAMTMYASAAESFRRLHARHAYTHLFIFNGSNISQQGLAASASAMGVRTLFFEIGNIEGKTFVDPKGVNARSLLYEKPSLLDSFTIADDEYRIWRSQYLDKKAHAHVIPQARRRRAPWEILKGQRDKCIRRIGTISGLTSHVRIAQFRRSIADRLASMHPLSYDTVTLDESPFIFFPMQVSTDSQIMLNSDFDNIAAIRHIAGLAKQRKLRLLVKPHPAERSDALLRRVADLRGELDFALVTDNTFHLMKTAAAVFTINSTVGLEALIMDKPVTFLGSSLFSYFTDNRDYLISYLLGYLVNASVYGNDPISKETIHQILGRADIG